MAIDQQEAKKSLFGNFQKLKKDVQEKKVSNKASQQVSNLASSNEIEKIETPLPSVQVSEKATVSNPAPLAQSVKSDNLERFFVRMTCEQRDVMDSVSKKLMRFRPKPREHEGERERITANCILRALVENFMERYQALEMKAIMTERDLYEWVGQLFRD
jgi:hypothetical protein